MYRTLRREKSSALNSAKRNDGQSWKYLYMKRRCPSTSSTSSSSPATHKLLNRQYHLSSLHSIQYALFLQDFGSCQFGRHCQLCGFEEASYLPISNFLDIYSARNGLMHRIHVADRTVWHTSSGDIHPI